MSPAPAVIVAVAVQLVPGRCGSARARWACRWRRRTDPRAWRCPGQDARAGIRGTARPEVSEWAVRHGASQVRVCSWSRRLMESTRNPTVSLPVSSPSRR